MIDVSLSLFAFPLVSVRCVVVKYIFLRRCITFQRSHWWAASKYLSKRALVFLYSQLYGDLDRPRWITIGENTIFCLLMCKAVCKDLLFILFKFWRGSNWVSCVEIQQVPCGLQHCYRTCSQHLPLPCWGVGWGWPGQEYYHWSVSDQFQSSLGVTIRCLAGI